MNGFVQQIALVALGGSVGAVARFLSSTAVTAAWGRAFPYGTLVVNVTGAFAIGVLFVVFGERLAGAVAWRALFITGFLGGFTTFSAFSLEAVQLIEAGEPARALLYAAASVVLCLLACWTGMVLTRQL